MMHAVGIFDRLRVATELAGTTERGILSPWAEGSLARVITNDVFGSVELPVTRAEAMTVPSVVKARNLIVGALAELPLVDLAGATRTEPQPAWLYRTNGNVPPWHRMAWTLDDLLFYGWSLWWVDRGTPTGGATRGPILDATRVAPSRWDIDADTGVVTVDQAPVNADDIILIPGPMEGLLHVAQRTIRGAVDVDRAWTTRARNPIPVAELHHVTDDQLTDDEIDALIKGYVKARRDPDGAVVYTPNAIELKVHGERADSTALVEARNAVRLDVANFTGLPAEALDGSLATASLTYTTQEGTRTELGDALRLWRGPIEARLSQDDVVPRGHRVRFDTASLGPVPLPTGPVTED